MNCPSCGRALATGAKTCVYCSHGNKYQQKQQLNVPAGSTSGGKSGFPWGRWAAIVVIVAVAAAVWFTPSLHAKIQPLIDKVKGIF